STAGIRVPKFNRPGVWPPFPAGPRDDRAWDEFWQGILASASDVPSGLRPGDWDVDRPTSVKQWLDEFYAEPLAELRMDCADHRYRDHLDTFTSLGLKRILCAGNG